MEFKNLKNYINEKNMSSTFRVLMNKYKKKLKFSRDLNKEIILREIYSKIEKIENEERENDYIISEVRRNAKINQEILYSFGTKALNHLNEVIKVNVTSKMDKNRFLGMSEDKNKYNRKIKVKNIKNQSFNKSKNNSKDKKFILLPIIINRNSKSKKIDENSLVKNEIRQNTSVNINNISKNDIPKNKRKNYVENYNYFGFKKEKSTEINSNSVNDFTPIKNIKENSNDSTILGNASLLTERTTKRIPKIDLEYINYLRTMGNQFAETEKRQEKYFYSNKYGIDAFKLKYNFLKKKFFN